MGTSQTPLSSPDWLAIRRVHAQTLLLAHRVWVDYHSLSSGETDEWFTTLNDYRDARRAIVTVGDNPRYGASEAYEVTQHGIDAVESARELLRYYGMKY